MASAETSCITEQETEILKVRSLYQGQVKVLSHIGEFQNVVIISPKDLDLQLKFQMTEQYPSSVPRVIIRSSSLSQDHQTTLTNHLQEEAEHRKGQPMIQHLTDAGLKWLSNNDIDLPSTSDEKNDLKTKERKEKKKPKKGKKDREESKESASPEKKSAMKTADDVIKRIQWDSDLQHDDFYVGYIDRFVGVVEKCFSAFSWEDLASVDMFTLAIPQHRIQYFKYKSEIVWDKNKRLDNFFGSTGSKITITTVIEHYQEKENERGDRVDCSNTTKEQDGAEGGKGSVEHAHESPRGNIDEIETDIWGLSMEGQGSNEDDEQIKDHIVDKRGRQDQRSKANYFLSLNIEDENILKNAEEMQELFISFLPNYADFIEPASSFHITLAVMKLEDTDQISHCSKLLKDMEPDLVKYAKKVTPLLFTGVGNFGTGIVFLDLKFYTAFLDFVDFVKESLRKGGVNICDDHHGFNPHMTLVKCPRNMPGKASHNKIAQCLKPFKGKNFGSQKLDGIHLCKMGREDGKYPVATTICFKQ